MFTYAAVLAGSPSVSKYFCYKVGPMVCWDSGQDPMLVNQTICELLDSRAN